MNILHAVRRLLLCGCLLSATAVPLRAQEGAPSPAGAAQAPLVLTLEQAIAMAKEQNRDVLIADQERYKADAQISEARSGAFPQVTVSGQYSRFLKAPVMFIPPGSIINPTNQTQMFKIGSDNSYSAGAQLYQTLYNRRVGVALDIASTYEQLAEEGYLATTEDVVLQVKKAFYGVLLAQKLVEANKQGLDVVRANYENVQSQYKHGAAAEFDLLRAEVQLANTEPLVTSAENGFLLAQYMLKNVLSIPLDREIRVDGVFAFDTLASEVLAEGRQKALSTNPSLVQLALQETMLDLNVGVQKAGYFPTLALIGGYQWQTQDNTFQFKNYNWANTVTVGLQLSLSLFDGFATNARIEQASIDLQKVRFTRMKAEEGLKIQIQSAELKMNEARKRIEGQEKNISQAEKAVRIAQTRFKSGVGTQLELLDTQVAMTRAQTNYAQAIYDYVVARAEWQRAVGVE